MSRVLGLPAALLLAVSCARPAPVRSPFARTWASAEAGDLLAGAACVDLTPDRPVPLGGYGARYGAAFTAVHDRPAARALLLRSQGRSIAIVSADLLVIPASLRTAVLARIEDLRIDGLLLAATHTHSGPGGYWDNWLAEAAGMGDHDPRWASALADRIALGVREAWGLLRPARVRWAADAAPDLVRNRRFSDGPVDPSLLLAVIEGAADEPGPVATILGFGAHPTVLGAENRLLSGDFPGVVRRSFEEETGAPALLLNGASGDLAPVVPGDGEGFEGTTRLGRALADRFRGMRPALSAPCGAGLAACERRVRLPGVNTRGAAGPIFRLLLDPLARTFTPAETVVQALRVGDLSIAAFPCDLGSGPGLALREGFPGPLLLVAYANDYMGYVVDERSFGRGGY
ncbi:MAG: neutral/alkaline non-lysosomal ceramidase N-terminal domain-containing protein, partial [Planctomycetota bacterium]